MFCRKSYLNSKVFLLIYIYFHIVFRNCKIRCLRLRVYDTGNVFARKTIGSPYPLPELNMLSNVKETSKHELSQSDDSLGKETLDNSNTQQINVNETTSASTLSNTESSGVTSDMIVQIKNSLATENEALARLKSEIEDIHSETRKEMKKQDVANQESGNPDKLLLEFQFPQREALNKKVQALDSNLTKSSNLSKNTSSTETISLSETLLPIPMIYVNQDARSQLGQVLKNAKDVAKEEVRFEEKEIENMAKNFPETIPEDIEKLQDLLDQLNAAIAFLKSDSEVTHLHIQKNVIQPSLGPTVHSSVKERV